MQDRAEKRRKAPGVVPRVMLIQKKLVLSPLLLLLNCGIDPLAAVSTTIENLSVPFRG